MPLTIQAQDNKWDLQVDNVIHLTLGNYDPKTPPKTARWSVHNTQDREVGVWDRQSPQEAVWRAHDVQPGVYEVRVKAAFGGQDEDARPERIFVQTSAVRVDGPVQVELQRTDLRETPDLALWEVIKLGTEAISFDNYAAWMDYLFCDGKIPRAFYPDGDRGRQLPEKGLGATWQKHGQQFRDPAPRKAPLPFPDIESYKILKAATEAFLEFNCGVVFDRPVLPRMRSLSQADRERLGLEPGESLRSLWGKYLVQANGESFIPYLYRVRQKIRDVELTRDPLGELCDKILEDKFTAPCLIELIWSYWHEEGMLVQTMNAISMRFQNRRRPGRGPDPLVNLTISPLRPLSNLLWGHIQDEQHRLTVARRAYEYDNEYGMTLLGEAVPRVQGAESRAGFLQAFHTLLHRASLFYREDDDTTMIADAFPLLNALREVHLLLAEASINQWRDLTWTARCEMLVEQWLLARPEFREFLPSRPMVVYPEPWMDRVDAMKKLQGWTEVSVRFFRDLGVFGEQILLSIRYGDWSNVTDREQAANWGRAWRQEVQWYIHAYQSVTGVDLSADMTDVRQAEQARARAMPPAYHLQRRLAEQRRPHGGAARQPVAQPSGRPS